MIQKRDGTRCHADPSAVIRANLLSAFPRTGMACFSPGMSELDTGEGSLRMNEVDDLF